MGNPRKPLRPEEFPEAARPAFAFDTQQTFPNKAGKPCMRILRTCLECGRQDWILTAGARTWAQKSAGKCLHCTGRERFAKTPSGVDHPCWKGGITYRNATIRSIKRAAIKRGYAFELSTEQVGVILKCDCAYCGAPPSNVRCDPSYKGREDAFRYNGIDRVDNTKGYVPGNVVACCFNCNRSKGEMSYADWIAHLEVVLRRAKTAAAK